LLIFVSLDGNKACLKSNSNFPANALCPNEQSYMKSIKINIIKATNNERETQCNSYNSFFIIIGVINIASMIIQNAYVQTIFFIFSSSS
jgi:hypothetical protein